MPARIDHVIMPCSDLAAAESAFARLGFFVTGGGTHPHLGTRNRVIVLGEGYLELVTVADPAAVSPALRERIEQRAGYIGFAAQSDDIAREVAAMRGRGVDARGPCAGRLVAPDGTARGWRTALVGDGDDLWAAAEPLPFLIQHDATGADHQRQLGGADGLAPHPNGATRILGVVVAADNLAALRARYAEVYGLASDAAPQPDGDLGALAVSLPLDGGAEEIRLAQPIGAGWVAERLAVAGAGLCALTLAVTSRSVAEGWLRGQGITAESTAGGDLAVRVPGARCGWIMLRETTAPQS